MESNKGREIKISKEAGKVSRERKDRGLRNNKKMNDEK